MPKTKKSTKTSVRTSSKAGASAAKSKKLKITLAVVGLLVAAVGGFLIYRSFAATGERRQNTTTCTASRNVPRNQRYQVRVTRITYNRNRAVVSRTTKNETRRAPRNQRVCTNEIKESEVIAPGTDLKRKSIECLNRNYLSRDNSKWRWNGSRCVRR